MKLGLYFTLGDLGLENSLALLTGVLQAGVDLLEIGLPFSDPLLDGIVIQQSHVRAVAQNISWQQLCSGIEKLKNICTAKQQISIMTSAQHLYDKTRLAQLSKVDGLLITDLKHNVSSPFTTPTKRVWFLNSELVLSANFQPPPEDISMVYLARVQGTTGENQAAEANVAEAIQRLRKVTDKDIWLGFGISSREDILNAQKMGADGAIIGSAFVNKVTEYFFAQIQHKTPQEQKNLLQEFGYQYKNAVWSQKNGP